MAVKVEAVTDSKSKKSLRVNLGGNWYGANKDSGLNNQVGQMIEAAITTGDFGPWIDGWKPANSNPTPTTPTPAPAPQPVVAAPQSYMAEPAKRIADTISEPELRFISNVVGQAILAKTAVEPDDVTMWALAAKKALKALI